MTLPLQLRATRETAAIAIPLPGRDSAARSLRLSGVALRGFAIAALVAFGSLALYPIWHQLVELWSHDPLRSIGAAFPFVALAGLMAAWRGLGWAMPVAKANWWGLLPIALALPLARFTSGSVAEIILGGHHIGLAHPGAVLLLYAAGAALLFGGWPLLRASIAPLLLLLAVNPVPFGYNTLVDLPLQELSANTARAFAHLIGLHPTGEQLKMMFAPDFGMLIVPGCNGVRGSITFAYLALIFGYSRGLLPRTLALVTGAAFLLGFALNLLRLCVLVLYYRAGLSFPSIQDYGVGVDYCIGCTIFLFATLSLGMLIRSLEPATKSAPLAPGPAAPPAVRVASRIACFLAVTLAFIVPQARLLATTSPAPAGLDAALHALPPAVGDYRLTRSYYEQLGQGVPAIVLGDYVSGTGAGASRLTLGLYIIGAHHTVGQSRLTQGIRAVESGALDATARSGEPVRLATSIYDDGVTRELYAEASCSVSACGDHVIASTNGPLLFEAPSFKDFVVVPTGKRLPMYLVRTAPDSDPQPNAALRSQFASDARHFVSQLDLSPIVSQVGSRP